MNGLMRGLKSAVLLGAGVAITGCSQLGGLGNVLGGVLGPQTGSGSGEVAGTVRYVDTQRQMLQITTQNGQTGSVYFDQRTRVVYQQQQYNVTALEQGDQVQMRLQQDQQGNYYTDYIVVTRSVQDANGGNNNGGYNNGTYNGGSNNGTYNNGGYAQVEGRVTWMDLQRGQFGLNTSNRGTLTVMMPYNSNNADASRFRNLRQGDYVRVEGQLVNNGTLQLQRFY
ncbi:hypothetical protein [Longimicrobium sp.]|uniref:hypothetical protein n=1 Tax=Longimicrobium sp. TaxID=2029185 RepID=UPI002B845F65|nr:hypothetical protein [Longimicrobium sp.]HSU12727.1 hypothetical protein [Longimicrobium sp.]